MEVYIKGSLYTDKRVWDWCKLPYPGHPKGCPNYNKKQGCPPNSSWVTDIFNLNLGHSFVIVEFDLRAHMRRMWGKHPNWSESQARCVLYWQAGINKELENQTKLIASAYTDSIYTLCPEAMGVNVIRTLKNIRFPIEVKPQNKVYKVALIGYPKRG